MQGVVEIAIRRFVRLAKPPITNIVGPKTEEALRWRERPHHSEADVSLRTFEMLQKGIVHLARSPMIPMRQLRPNGRGLRDFIQVLFD
jgi:hypothetical protein